MYVSKDGEFFDYLHGEEDLKNGRVTFIGNPLDRIREDALRILRYYRFCAYLRDYSHSYAKVLQQTAHLIKKLSIERIQYELFRTIHSNTVINTMYNDEVLRVISKDASIEAFNRINNAETTDIIRICALFPFEFVLGVLRIKKDERQLVKKYKKFLFEDLDYCFYKEGIQFAGDMAIIKLAKLNIPINNSLKFKGMEKFPLTYHDLPTCTKNASKILRACEKWWVGNGGINTKEECLEYVKTIDLSI
jgi:hypothetical protein